MHLFEICFETIVCFIIQMQLFDTEKLVDFFLLSENLVLIYKMLHIFHLKVSLSFIFFIKKNLRFSPLIKSPIES